MRRRELVTLLGGAAVLPLAAARAVATAPSRAAAAPPFVTSPPVRTYDFLRDPTINFQLNRWVSLGGDPLLREIQAMLPRLSTLEGCRDEFSAASDRMLATGNQYEAAILARGADFFMVASDPRKWHLRKRFLTIVRAAWGVSEPDHVQFANGYLPYYRFTPANPRGTIVLFGGFDSYIEEFFSIMMNLRDQGHDVVAFEGPGQGGALEDAGLAMTSDWQLPVGAIMDRLSLSGVTLSAPGPAGLAGHAPRPPIRARRYRNRRDGQPLGPRSGPGMGSGAVDACIWRELACGGASSSCQLSYTGDLAAGSSRRASPGGCRRSLHTGAPGLRSGRRPDECTVGDDPNVLEGRECTNSLPNRQPPAGDPGGHRLAGSAPEYSSGLTGSDTWVLHRISSGSFGTFKTSRHVHSSVANR